MDNMHQELKIDNGGHFTNILSLLRMMKFSDFFYETFTNLSTITCMCMLSLFKIIFRVSLQSSTSSEEWNLLLNYVIVHVNKNTPPQKNNLNVKTMNDNQELYKVWRPKYQFSKKLMIPKKGERIMTSLRQI